MHKGIKTHRNLATQMLMLGPLLVFSAFSGLGCPDTSGSSDLGAAPTFRAFAYITNAGDNTITGYSADAGTGALTPVGSWKTGTNPVSVTVASAAILGYASSLQVFGFVYVANKGSNTISQYRFDNKGALTPLNPPTVPTGSQPASLVYGHLVPESNNNGQLDNVFVVNQADNTVNDYLITGDGTLTLNGSITSSGTLPLKVTSDGRSVYVLNAGDRSLCQINYGLGARTLTSRISLPAGNIPVDLAQPFNTEYLLDSNHNTITQYMTDPTLVAQTSVSVPSSPDSVAGDVFSDPATPYKDGTLVMFVGSSVGSIYQYQQDLSTTGAKLVPQSAAPVTFPPQPIVLRINQDHNVPGTTHRLYVLLTGTNKVRTYTIANLAIDASTMTETGTGSHPTDMATGFAAVNTGSVQTNVKSVRNAR